MIRRARADDHDWIVDLGSRVYAELGDYRAILPGWLEHPGVIPYVAERDGEACGFILVGYYVPSDTRGGSVVADLLAIAVEPRRQRRGIGRQLLDHAIGLAESAARASSINEIRLTVADTNCAGRRLFERAGFRVLDPDHGSYDGGQRAIRMSRPLNPRLASEASPRRL